MLWEEELEAKRIQDDEDRKRKVRKEEGGIGICMAKA